MVSDMPVSVAAVITFYRDDAWFPEALASVLAQTRMPDEIVVVDDASPPGEATTLEHLDPRVRVVRQAVNQGPGAARQAGSDATTAEWIAYLDADDVWLPEKLQRQLEYARANPGCDAVHCAVIEFRRNGAERVFDRKPVRIDLAEGLRVSHVLPSALMIRRDALLAVGGWPLERRIVDDWDLTVRQLAAGQTVGFVTEPLLRLRRYGHGNLSGRTWDLMLRSLRMVRRNRHVYLQTLGLRGTLRVCGGIIAGGGRNGGVRGRLMLVAGRVLGYRER
jgi:glycosyltransferase involved in cell wall biosynthesis